MKAIIDFLQQQLSAIIQCIPVILHHKHQRNVFLLQSYILLQVATLPNVEPEQIFASLLVLPPPVLPSPPVSWSWSHDLDLMILISWSWWLFLVTYSVASRASVSNILFQNKINEAQNLSTSTSWRKIGRHKYSRCCFHILKMSWKSCYISDFRNQNLIV